jgi:hypothetical protein
LLVFLLVCTLGLFGCDKVQVTPDVHPENKDGDWYFGLKFKGEF